MSAKIFHLAPKISDKTKRLSERISARRLAAMKLVFYADGIFDLAEGLGRHGATEFATTLDKIALALDEVAEMLGKR